MLVKVILTAREVAGDDSHTIHLSMSHARKLIAKQFAGYFHRFDNTITL